MKNFVVKRKIPLMLISSGLLSALPLIFTSLGFLQWVAFIPAAIALILSADTPSMRLRGLYGLCLPGLLRRAAGQHHQQRGHRRVWQ